VRKRLKLPRTRQRRASSRSRPPSIACCATTAAWRDGDGQRLAALFTEDGFAVQNGSPIRHGRAAIADGVTKPGGALQLTAYAYSSSGDVGYIIGGYRYPTTVGAGGRFVLALRSGPDGRWLIAADLDNSGPRPGR
jgi:ketosteroid isomerase-like protein